MANKDKKKKSSIIKDAIALCVITLVAGLALGSVYEVTEGLIQAAKEAKELEAYKVVFTKDGELSEDSELMQVAAELDMGSVDADYAKSTIDKVIKVTDGSDEVIGYIIALTNNEGYNPPISITMGYDKDGITGLEFLALNETPGFGSKAAEPDFKDQFIDKFDGKITLGDQVNAISGATVTSKAVVNAVNAGLSFIENNGVDLGGGSNE